ncbi:MAG: undecaprenyl-phosphate glucose phosphotransferase [Alphaproteobacteria bacterium]|nr:undecaprenyl-phosphate glucose phosphotransferase [Alphaproteobacteria bacterium]
MNLVSQPILTGFLRLGDLMMVVLAALMAHLVRFGDIDLSANYSIVVLLVCLIAAHVFQMFRLYEFGELSRFLFQAPKLFLAWTVVILVLLTIGFLTKTSEDYSRIWVLIFFVFGFVGLALLRFGVKQQIRRWQANGRLLRKVAVLGAGEHGERLVHHLLVRGTGSVQLVGIFDDRRTRVQSNIEGYPVRGDTEDLLALVREKKVDQIIIALPWSAESRIFAVLRRLRTVPIDVRLSPERVAYRFPSHGFSELSGISLLNVFEKPLSPWQVLLKEAEDRVLALLILVFISPLLLTIAILIKLDSPGPVLFRQQRFGFNKEVFTVYKFRTMHHVPHDESAVPQARLNDPRITRLGSFLRRASLDELPQFFNVLQGTMSIVGPRPHAMVHDEEFAALMDEYLARHNVKPGITGWAQINGYRGEIEKDEDVIMRVQHDLYYIENWSLWFDLRIIILTVFKGFVHQKAY